MKQIIFITVILIAAGISTAEAQATRAHKQHARILNGAKSGSLTKKETKQVVQQQRAIRAEVKNAKSDGTVSNKEKRQIIRSKNQASRSIYRKKHNSNSRN
jgi:multidrug resistance efflux pump